MIGFWLWAGFIVFVLVMLAIDLGLINRKAKVISTRQALIWTGFCAILALLFCVATHYMYEDARFGLGQSAGKSLSGRQAAEQFLTGWLIEQSLSLDNILVIALIFAYFRVPLAYQHRVLFWGVLGALLMRGVMIGLGAALIQRFSWVTYIFAAILIATAIKLLITSGDHVEPEKNPLVRLARRFYKVTPSYEGHHFFSTIDGKRAITPLFLVLLVVESTDVLFAVDSIPAIFAVTTDPFLVFTSNVFAILALRSLYFALAGVIDMFRYLKTALVFVLAFVGVKMLLTHHFPIPTTVSLAVVVGLLGVGVLASVIAARRYPSVPATIVPNELAQFAQVGWRQARRLVVLVIGISVVLFGVAAAFLPFIPGFLIVPLGLAILATEFLWARKLLRRAKETAQSFTAGWRGAPVEPERTTATPEVDVPAEQPSDETRCCAGGPAGRAGSGPGKSIASQRLS